MPAITPKDWGRIYAYIWRDALTGTGEYKKLFEKDPASAVKQIAEQLEIGIDYFDCLFEVDVASDFSPQQLQMIIDDDPNAPPFKFFLRLTC